MERGNLAVNASLAGHHESGMRGNSGSPAGLGPCQEDVRGATVFIGVRSSPAVIGMEAGNPENRP